MTPRPRPLPRRCATCSNSGAASVRTSPTWKSAAWACSTWGLAARYVSGYLRTEPPPGQPRLVGVDASHAWLSVYCPPTGWVGLDPTNDQIPSDKHILLAWGRDYDDVSPIKGVNLGGGRHSVTVGVDVALEDSPELGMGLS